MLPGVQEYEKFNISPTAVTSSREAMKRARVGETREHTACRAQSHAERHMGGEGGRLCEVTTSYLLQRGPCPKASHGHLSMPGTFPAREP